MGNWLKEDSTEKLRQIRAYHGDVDDVGRAANGEIRRRESEDAKSEAQSKELREQQRHEELVALEKSKPNKNFDHGADDYWYKKPKGIITLSVISTLIAGLLVAWIKYKLRF
jgi:hypothetical protein